MPHMNIRSLYYVTILSIAPCPLLISAARREGLLHRGIALCMVPPRLCLRAVEAVSTAFFGGGCKRDAYAPPESSDTTVSGK